MDQVTAFATCQAATEHEDGTKLSSHGQTMGSEGAGQDSPEDDADGQALTHVGVTTTASLVPTH